MIRLLNATNYTLPKDDDLEQCQTRSFVIISHVWYVFIQYALPTVAVRRLFHFVLSRSPDRRLGQQ